MKITDLDIHPDHVEVNGLCDDAVVLRVILEEG